MTMRLAALVALAMSGPAIACDFPAPHPIDRAFDAAVEQSGGVTVALRDAQGEAWAAWDAELNRTYARLRTLTPPASRDILRDAQRAWLAFDSAQSRWDAAMLAEEGSAAALGVSAAALTRRRARVCELASDLKTLELAREDAGLPSSQSSP